MTGDLSRREFLAATMGLALCLTDAPRAEAAVTPFAPSPALTITPDGVVTVHVIKTEMGQGIGTALAQIVGEELEVDWGQIRIDYPIYHPKYGLGLTSANSSVRTSFRPLSQVAAAARGMLIAAAAGHWRVSAAECLAERGTVRHPPSGRSISYGELVARAPIAATLTPDALRAIPLKRPVDYTLVGRWIPRREIPDMVAGRTTFGDDLVLPGLVHAKVAYPPTRAGSRLLAVDDSRARAVAGYLRTVVDGTLVAAVAATPWAALKARDALQISWDPGPHAAVSSAGIVRDYEARARQGPGTVWIDTGDVGATLAGAARVHTATYTTDFAAHAQMEPLCCVARHTDGEYDLFAGTQWATRALEVLSKRLGVAPAAIRIHPLPLGGSFGLGLEFDVMAESAVIAREVGRPVKLLRSREEDFQRDYYRTPTVQVMRAGLDGAGRLTAWEHTLVASAFAARWGRLDSMGRDLRALRGAEHLYDIPSQLVREIRDEHAIPIGAYRGVAPGYTLFAVETFLDELAVLTGVDPLQLRISLLSAHPRLVNVLRIAAAQSDWTAPLPTGAGRGLACAPVQAGLKGDPREPTWTAVVVQTRVDRGTGDVTVERLVCVVDCGIVVNPGGLRAQIEGALVFGLSTALKELGSISHGAFDQANFEDYRLLRMDEVPEIDIHVVRSTEAPTGIGETPNTLVAPALSNAIFAAVGARLRNLPFVPARVLAALAAAGSSSGGS